MRYIRAALRLFVAFVAVVATWDFAMDDPTVWFTTFTSQSNMLMAVVMVLAAVADLAGKAAPPAWLQATATLYLVITGLVYTFIIGFSNYPVPGVLFGLPGSYLHHIVTPIGTLLVWLLFVEHRTLKWKWAGLWLAYLYIYLAVALIRGIFFDVDYPYDFIDLNALGWGSLAVNVVIYSVGFAALGAALIGIDRVLPGRTRLSEAASAGHAPSGTAMSRP